MEHSPSELRQQIKAIHPEIDLYGLDFDLEYKPEKQVWLLKLEKDDLKLHTYLDKKDADACMEGVQCVYLGVQLGQFINNFKIKEYEEKNE